MTTTRTKAICVVLAVAAFCGVAAAQSPPDDPFCGDEAGSDVDPSLGPAGRAAAELCKASARGDTETVQRMLKAGVNPNIPQQSNLTPLAWAARCGHLDTVAALVAGGADVNARFVFWVTDMWRIHDSTALFWAARNDQVDIVKYLLSAGADPHQREQNYKVTELDPATDTYHAGNNTDHGPDQRTNNERCKFCRLHFLMFLRPPEEDPQGNHRK